MWTATYPRSVAQSRATPGEITAWAVALIGTAAFLYLNIHTAMSVLPWTDEVMQIDAAVNLHLGKGWVSTAWQSQSQLEFWAANNPLYTFLVYVWISVFGFTPPIVRSLNLVLACVVTWLVVDTCWRARWIRSWQSAAVLALLILCDDALCFVYRSGRADLTTMLAVAALFRVFVLVELPRRRRLLLVLFSIPLLASGLHSIPYLALLLLFNHLVRKNSGVADLMSIAGGALLGAVGLLALYASKHALVAYLSQTLASGYNIVGAAWQALYFRDSGAVSRFLTVLAALLPLRVARTIVQDAGLGMLIAFFPLVILLGLWNRSQKLARAALLSLIVALLVPYGMLAAGRYAYYYAWMGAVPVAVGFVIVLEKLSEEGWRSVRLAGAVVVLIAVLLGMPARIWHDVSLHPAGQYAEVERTFRRETQPSDVVYSDPLFYYAAKRAGNEFYSLTYAGGRGYRNMSATERGRVSLALVPTQSIEETQKKLGGGWSRVAELPSLGLEPITVLRRATPTS